MLGRDEAVGAGRRAQGPLGRRRVDHEGEVDIVQDAPVEQLLRAAEVADDAVLPKLPAEFQLDELLGRDSDEADGAGKTVEGAGGGEAGGDAEERGIEMEITTASACLAGGSDAVIMRHPAAIKAIADMIEALV